MLVLLLGLSAWNAEYPGFIHYTSWAAAAYTAMPSDICPPGLGGNLCHMPDGTSQLPVDVSKDLCALDSKCEMFRNWDDGTTFRSFNNNASYDTYLALNSSLIAGSAICRIVSGGKNSLINTYLQCDTECLDRVLATYASPPDLIHNSCVKNPACIGFRVKNDGSSGDLLKVSECLASGWFAMPDWRRNI